MITWRKRPRKGTGCAAWQDSGKSRSGAFASRSNMARFRASDRKGRAVGHERATYRRNRANMGRFAAGEGRTCFSTRWRHARAQNRMPAGDARGGIDAVGGQGPIRANVRSSSHPPRPVAVDPTGGNREICSIAFQCRHDPASRRCASDSARFCFGADFRGCGGAARVCRLKGSTRRPWRLRRYRWPGNDCELEKSVRRLAALYRRRYRRRCDRRRARGGAAGRKPGRDGRRRGAVLGRSSVTSPII